MRKGECRTECRKEEGLSQTWSESLAETTPSFLREAIEYCGCFESAKHYEHHLVHQDDLVLSGNIFHLSRSVGY